jgi:hypothetical protein
MGGAEVSLSISNHQPRYRTIRQSQGGAMHFTPIMPMVLAGLVVGASLASALTEERERLRQKNWQDGIKHFGRDVGKEVREGEQKCVPRKPRKIPLCDWFSHEGRAVALSHASQRAITPLN